MRKGVKKLKYFIKTIIRNIKPNSVGGEQIKCLKLVENDVYF